MTDWGNINNKKRSNTLQIFQVILTLFGKGLARFIFYEFEMSHHKSEFKIILVLVLAGHIGKTKKALKQEHARSG